MSAKSVAKKLMNRGYQIKKSSVSEPNEHEDGLIEMLPDEDFPLAEGDSLSIQIGHDYMMVVRHDASDGTFTFFENQFNVDALIQDLKKAASANA